MWGGCLITFAALPQAGFRRWRAARGAGVNAQSFLGYRRLRTRAIVNLTLFVYYCY